jgi:Ca-activated chloride channel homolog
MRRDIMLRFKGILFVFSLLSLLLLLTGCASYDKGYRDSYVPDWNDYDTDNEEYNLIEENPIKDVLTSPLSTFSIDVDTASYSNMRRFLNDGQLPPKDAIRTEELVNYFTFDLEAPEEGKPFSVSTEVASAPWNDQRLLAMIALNSEALNVEEFPPSNLVFLIDVSGSMSSENKLPLVKSSMKLLVDQLREEDKVSIVVYASDVGVKMHPTSGSNKETIKQVIDELHASGSTSGGKGLEYAYEMAKEGFIEGGNNRVILASDGDFNVGIQSQSDLTRFIETKRNEGIFLSVLGYGMGNYKDSKMETLADKGNGNYAYIDNFMEARKVLVEQMSASLLTLAKDVKIQIEFNPNQVKGYRLIGYENRILNNEDFEDDEKDAGEMGPGHTVIAFYELIPADSDEEISGIDDLKYQDRTPSDSTDLFSIAVRYKEPTGDTSQLLEKAVDPEAITENPSQNFRFASSVVEFSQLLRDSKFKGNSSYDQVIARAEASKGEDVNGYRSEFIQLVKLAKDLANSQE